MKKQLIKQAICIVVMFQCSFVVSAVLNNEDIQQAYAKSYNYEKLGNYGDAINVLVMVFKEYPKAYTINMRLAHLYYLKGNYVNASSRYFDAKKAKSGALSPQIGLMKVSNTREQFVKTEELGYKVLQIDYFNYYANLYLSYALRKSEKFEAAQTINLKMLDIYPEDISFLSEYGLVSYSQKEYTKSFSAFAYVQVLDPENITAKEMLTMLSLNQGSAMR